MEYIHFEKQQGSLCAQHCLNALLQGPYFTAVDLATIGKELDEAERQKMAEGDVTSDDYMKFMNQPSSNMDDSGFFSIQVICRALDVWNLIAIPYSSPKAASARENPVSEKAFICNLRQHWFTIRKLGKQWFNLNSVTSGPELVSETYLNMLLTQLQNEGYSIFVVRGVFPGCESDQILNLIPVDPSQVKSTATRGKTKHTSKEIPEPKANVEDIRKKREKFYASRFNNDNSETSQNQEPSVTAAGSSIGESEEQMLQKALELSLSQK